MYSKEFYSELEKINRLAYEYKLLSESVNVSDIINGNAEVLTEAIINKEKFIATKRKILDAIRRSLEKFLKMTDELIKRNGAMIKKFKEIDTSLIDFDKIGEIAMLNFNNAYKHLIEYNPPRFNPDDAELLTMNNGIGYKVGDNARFQRGIFDNNGKAQRYYFYGGNPDANNIVDCGFVQVDSRSAESMFKDCLNFLEKRKELTNKIEKITRDSIKVSEQILKSTADNRAMTESISLDDTIFKNDIYDILFEDAMSTPNEIRKEENNTSPENNTNIAQQKVNKNNSKLSEAVIAYAEIMHSVTSVIMMCCDHLYGEAGKFCTKVSQLPNKTK